MATENPTIAQAGTNIATGPADVTVNPTTDVAWATGTTLAGVSALAQKHMFYANVDRSLTLSTGESLFVFGRGPIAVTVTSTA